MRLSAQADLLGAPVRMALTATAAPPVQREIVRRLGLRDPEVVTGDFDRPQLELSARGVARLPTSSESWRWRRPSSAARGSSTPRPTPTPKRRATPSPRRGTASRSTTPAYPAGAARGDGGLPRWIRSNRRGDRGLRNGNRQPDVRWVVHVDPPPSLDAYYQEIGRAGRDGRAAHARLLYRQEDFGASVHLAARGVSTEAVAGVAAQLVTGGELAHTRGETAALVRLVDLGAAVWEAGGAVRWTGRAHGRGRDGGLGGPDGA